MSNPKQQPTTVDNDTRLLAAIAYGEASVKDDVDEIQTIAYVVVNRARAWNKKTIQEMLAADRNYTYAANGSNARFNLLMSADSNKIEKTKGISIAIDAAKNALSGGGQDLSNGAYWWDGPDLKLRRSTNMRVQLGFRYGAPAHNIYRMEEIVKPTSLYWKVKNKKTGLIEQTKLRGSYDSGYISTAAFGDTIFWKYNPDYISATGTVYYR